MPDRICLDIHRLRLRSKELFANLNIMCSSFRLLSRYLNTPKQTAVVISPLHSFRLTTEKVVRFFEILTVEHELIAGKCPFYRDKEKAPPQAGALGRCLIMIRSSFQIVSQLATSL